MRLFVTGHSSRFGGGISVAQNLITAFGNVAPEHRYFFTIPPRLGYEASCQIAPQSEVLIYEQWGLMDRWIWERFRLPAVMRTFKPDVIFNMANRGFTSCTVPQATLIQDTHLFYPNSQYGEISLLERFKFWYHRHHLKKSLKSTQLLFCQNDFAAARIRECYGTGFKIAICPNQLSRFTQKMVAGMPEPLQTLDGKFKLFMPTRYYSHKNLEIVLPLFELHSQALHEVVFILTISPDQHPNAARLLENVKKRGLERNIITVGPLKQEELATYYTYTDALFLPTLLESSSGAYIKAMHFGRPILTSDTDFTRAFCCGAALYFNPRDTSDICRAILELRDKPKLRQKLVENGEVCRQSQSLSWNEIGLGVIRELESLASYNR